MLSLLIPLAHIDISSGNDELAQPVYYPVIASAHYFETTFVKSIEQPTPLFSLSIGNILLGIYLIGFIFMFSKLVIGLHRLFQIIKQSKKEKKDKVVLLRHDTDIPAASFFSYVFWKGDTFSESEKIIMQHEMVHIRQFHSLDVLLMELMVIIKWFNPLIHLFRKSLRATHEFIADQYIVQQGAPAYDYAKLLSKQTLGDCHSMVNTFNSLTKIRIKMLATKSSAQWRKVKYFLSLPVIVSLMLLFSFDLVEKVPGGDRFSELSLNVEQMANKEVLNFSKSNGAAIQLNWGEKECDCKPYNSGFKEYNYYQCPSFQMSKDELLALVNKPVKIYKSGSRLKVIEQSAKANKDLFEGDVYLTHGKPLKKWKKHRGYFEAIEEGMDVTIKIKTSEKDFLNFKVWIGDEVEQNKLEQYELEWGGMVSFFNDKKEGRIIFPYEEIEKNFAQEITMKDSKGNQIPIKAITTTIPESGNEINIKESAKENPLSIKEFIVIPRSIVNKAAIKILLLKTDIGNFNLEVRLEVSEAFIESNRKKEDEIKKAKESKAKLKEMQEKYLAERGQRIKELNEMTERTRKAGLKFQWGKHVFDKYVVMKPSEFKRLSKEKMKAFLGNGTSSEIVAVSVLRQNERVDNFAKGCETPDYKRILNHEVTCYLDLLAEVQRGDFYKFTFDLEGGMKKSVHVLINPKTLPVPFPPSPVQLTFGKEEIDVPFDRWIGKSFFRTSVEMSLDEFKQKLKQVVSIKSKGIEDDLIDFHLFLPFSIGMEIEIRKHFFKYYTSISDPDFENALKELKPGMETGMSWRTKKSVVSLNIKLL